MSLFRRHKHESEEPEEDPEAEAESHPGVAAAKKLVADLKHEVGDARQRMERVESLAERLQEQVNGMDDDLKRLYGPG